jgi:hypothetical protein
MCATLKGEQKRLFIFCDIETPGRAALNVRRVNRVRFENGSIEHRDKVP